MKLQAFGDVAGIRRRWSDGLRPFIVCLLLFGSGSGLAGDLQVMQRMSLELARDLAQAAVEACREDGFQVAVVVVDRGGDIQVILRDAMASRFNVQMAGDKANAVILSGGASSGFRKNRQDIRMEVNHLRDVLMLDGGLPVWAGGALVGAIGVSGAAGGDKDELCAKRALDRYRERLEFAD